MTIKSGFFNAVQSGGAWDRKYSAEDMGEIFKGIIKDGVYADEGERFKVEISSERECTVIVKPGRCFFNGKWMVNDSDLTVELSNAMDVYYKRRYYDAIIICVDYRLSERSVSIQCKTGASALHGAEGKPDMEHSNDKDEYPIAYIHRRGENNVISPDNIEYVVGTSECPYVTTVLSHTSTDEIENDMAERIDRKGQASINEWGLVKFYASTTGGVLINKSGLAKSSDGNGGIFVATKQNGGVKRDGSGQLQTDPATEAEAKAGTETLKPITPATLKAVLDEGGGGDGKGVYFGTCETNTTPRVVTLASGADTFSLTEGRHIIVLFRYPASTNCQLQVGSTAAKDIKVDGVANSQGLWGAYSAVEFIYHSGAWYVVGTSLASSTVWGSVKLSDDIAGTETSQAHTAATPYAVKRAAEAPAQSLDGNAVTLDSSNSIKTITVDGVFDGSRQEIDCPITASDYNATGGTINAKFVELEDRIPIFGACSTSSNDAIKDVYLGKDYADEQPIVIRFTDSVKPLSSGALKLRVWTGSSGTPIAYPVKFDSQDDIVVAGGEFTDNDVIVNNHSYLTVVRIYNDAYPEDTYWQIVSSDYNYAIKSKVAALEARIAALEQHALLDSSYTNPNNN